MRRNLLLNCRVAILSFFIAALFNLFIPTIIQHNKLYAIKATDFNPGRIIDDEIFYNKDTMSVQQIQAWLDSQVGGCDVWGVQRAYDWGRGDITRAEFARIKWGIKPPFVCLNHYHENPQTKETSYEKGGGWFEGGVSAAQIIYDSAQKYNINPQVLLILLKKESLGPLTNDKWPLKNQYRYAMGYACPDSGPGYSAACSESKGGFYNQVNLAAWQLDYYRKNHMNGGYSLRLGWNNIQYSPNPSCGFKRVHIDNVATLSLYIYTPYTPNDDALNAYPGESYCGSYGNRNFFMFFNQIFGSSLVSTAEYQKMDQPRRMIVSKNTNKVNVFTGEYLGVEDSLKEGQLIDLSTKIKLMDGRLCLRSKYDTTNSLNKCILFDELKEIPTTAEYQKMD